VILCWKATSEHIYLLYCTVLFKYLWLEVVSSVILCWNAMLVLLQWDHISLAHCVIRLSTSPLSRWLAARAATQIIQHKGGIIAHLTPWSSHPRNNPPVASQPVTRSARHYTKMPQISQHKGGFSLLTLWPGHRIINPGSI
jgi:hypothetical protein